MFRLRSKSYGTNLSSTTSSPVSEIVTLQQTLSHKLSPHVVLV